MLFNWLQNLVLCNICTTLYIVQLCNIYGSLYKLFHSTINNNGLEHCLICEPSHDINLNIYS
jgi:hypothetical protein